MHTLRHIKSLLANPYEPENMRALIDVYWRILLGIAAISMVGIFAYGALKLMFVMDDVTTMNSNASSSTSSALIIRSDQIDRVLNGFVVRRDQFENLKASSTRIIVDPSQ